MQIIESLNNNCFQGTNHPRFIVIHGTAGGTSAQAIAKYFVTAKVSSHYVIGVDGIIVRCIKESDGAWANGVVTGIPTQNLPFREYGDGLHRDYWWHTSDLNPNNETISIEHCKNSDDNSDELTPEQEESSFWLIADICKRHNIPMRFADRDGGITGHFSIDPVDRSKCPGNYPWQKLFSYLRGEEPVKQFIASSRDFDRYFYPSLSEPAIWECKQTGCHITGSNLSYYQQLSVDGNALPVIGLPMTNETHLTDKDGYNWTIQIFERAIMVYDPEHRKDSQPGGNDSYIAKYRDLVYLDPYIPRVVENTSLDSKQLVTEIASMLLTLDHSK